MVVLAIIAASCTKNVYYVTNVSDGGAAGSSGNGSGGTSGKGGTSSGGASGGSAQAGTTGAAGDGGTGGQAPLCDTTALADGCTLSDDGIFVAPTGDDANDGATRAAPVATIAKGIELAAAQAKPLYICNSNYDEAVALDSAANDLAIYGGFTCPDKDAPDPGWLYTEGSRAVVAPTTPGYALTIDGASGITLSDLEFDAIDGAAPGESSIAAFVSLSEAIVLNRVKLVAGKGQDGDDGVLEAFTLPSADDLKGNDAVALAEGNDKTCMCPAGDSTIGGLGGNGGGSPGSGTAGTPDHGGGAAGILGQACAGTGTGGDGGNASVVNDGAGASVYAIFNSAGWAPKAGANGTDGGVGQGGGGGKGAADGGGGGGACGGCGGAGSTGGKGGGSSIGLLAFHAAITLDTVTIITDDAGDGGDSVAGQAGQTGGVKGNSAGSACDGGAGGTGADGSAGGGGAGGVSVGIVYSGDEPGLDGGSIMVGMKGLKGTGSASNDGLDGLSTATLMMP